jgi:glycosyltransferase involved in cell wall biosynthesis
VNIVHVVESLALGGLERVVVSLVGIQIRHGHRVRVVCLFQEGVLAAQVRALGAEVIVCHKTAGLNVRALRALREAVRAFDADVVHTHNAVAHYYAALATIGLRLGSLLNTRHGMGSFPFSWRRELLYRIALARSDAAVSVCEAARQRFVSHRIMPTAKALTVRNGADVSLFDERNPAARAELLAACAIKGEPIVFGTVGRLSAAKDHAGLLLAMRRLVDDGVNAILVIVGDGELRDALHAQCERLELRSRVHLLGARSDIPRLLAAFDAFVLSSVTEGYSLALVEACAAALPCVVTDVGGNGEIVRNRVSGMLVPPGAPVQLATAMRSVCESPQSRAAMGRSARAWALENGTLEAMYRQYHAIYVRGHAEADGPRNAPDGEIRRG